MADGIEFKNWKNRNVVSYLNTFNCTDNWIRERKIGTYTVNNVTIRILIWLYYCFGVVIATIRIPAIICYDIVIATAK